MPGGGVGRGGGARGGPQGLRGGRPGLHRFRGHELPADRGRAGAVHGGEERALNEPEAPGGSPEIETDRLVLRPLATGDLDAVHRLWTDPGVRRYLWDGEEIPREKARNMLVRSAESFGEHGFGLWAVTEKGPGALIGFCGFWPSGEDGRGGELLYGITTPRWGEGLATEVAEAMVRHGFEDLGLDRIVAGADTENAASLRVMEKAGMIHDGRDLRNGKDLTYYALSREAFRRSLSDAPG
ncbi:GNAT family N-acetyltransferase [Rubrobacter marinus]|nr:GNAT family N-acetyltransferase [Rubrobacter marinus]